MMTVPLSATDEWVPYPLHESEFIDYILGQLNGVLWTMSSMDTILKQF